MHQFKVGDLVQLSDLAARSARHPARIGVVVALARSSDTQVRVLWSSRDTHELIHVSLLQHADKHVAETNTAEVRAIQAHARKLGQFSR